MGKVLAPVGSMFGIGQHDDPTFYNKQDRQAQYDKFVDGDHPEIDGTKGTQMASDQVQNDAITGKLFGAGGLQSQLQNEGNDLASRGYSLQQPDHEAYGQAAGDITRQFGQQEDDAAAALARRGLGGASSGAALQTYAGLAGNKNEMLAKAQTDIAQKRMQDTQQRLQANRQLQTQLGAQGASAVGSQFDRQMGGYNAKLGALGQSSKLEQGANDQGRQANEDAIGHKSKNIGDAWAEGKYSGTKSGESDATASWMKMGGSSSMAMSDENNKTGIGDGGPKVRSFLKGIANSHDYGVVKPSEGSGKSSAPAKSSSPMGSMFGGQPHEDGSYDASPKDLNDMNRANNGLTPYQNGSKGMFDPVKNTMDAGGGTTGGAQYLFSSGGGGAGSGGMGELMSMFSDERTKEHIHGGDAKVRGFLDSIEPHSYEYKDEYKDNPLAGPGEHVSPMAQELEKTELGKGMVQDTPDGKVVDYGKGFGTMLAGLADINKRLTAMEAGKGKK